MNFFKKAFLKLSSSKTISTKIKLFSTEYYELYVIEKNEYTFSNLKDKTINAIIGLTKSNNKSEEDLTKPIRSTFFYNNKFEYKFYSKSVFNNLRGYIDLLNNNYLIKFVYKEDNIMKSDIYFQYTTDQILNQYKLKYIKYNLYDEYIIKTIAKGLKYLHDNSISINKLNIENIKITFDGFIKLGELQTIEKFTKFKIEKDNELFDNLCIKILGESEKIYKIDDFLNKPKNIFEIIEEELQQTDTLSKSTKFDIFNKIDLNLLNEQLKNKLIIIFLMDLIKNNTEQITGNKLKNIVKTEEYKFSDEIIKYNLKHKRVSEEMNFKKIVLYGILEMECINLSDYLEMLFNIKDLEIIKILLKETDYYLKEKSKDIIYDFKINSLDLLNENHPYLKQTGYTKYCILDFSNINLLDILFNFLSDKHLKNDVFDFLLKIFLFLKIKSKKYFLNKLNNKDLTIKILNKYLFVILYEVCTSEYTEIYKKDLSEKDIKKLQTIDYNNTSFIDHNTSPIDSSNNCRKEYMKLIISLLNDQKYFYRAVLLLNFSYKHLSKNVLVLDVLPLLCKNLLDNSIILFEVITKILDFLRFDRDIHHSIFKDKEGFFESKGSFKEIKKQVLQRKGSLDDESSITTEKAKEALNEKPITNTNVNLTINLEKSDEKVKKEKLFENEESDEISW